MDRDDPRGGRGGALALAAALIAASACSPDGGGAPVETARLPVFYGEREPGEPGTVRIVATGAGGVSCSGSVVGRTAILTANHCVEGTRAEDWVVQTGMIPSTLRGVWVREIVRPGPFLEDSQDDVALLVLGSPVDLPIYTPAFDLGDLELYDEVTIVGYGLDERGGSGIKLRGTMGVVTITDLWLRLAGDSYPGSGDSGGPIFDSRGQIIAVVSRGGPTIGIVTRVDAFRWLLDAALRDNGGCVPGDPELCDGVDNNCDMVVDEGCLGPGAPCASADRCTTGLCEVVAGERVCTRPCGSAEGLAPCWEDSYCFESSCGEGLCRPGEPGSGEPGEPCEDDLDCRSLLCRDPGEGGARCAEPCRLDALECGGGEVCVGLEGECAACFDGSLVTAPRGLGEACEEGGECRSGTCLDDPPRRYCTEPCGRDRDCPDAMHCRAGSCVLGLAGELGMPCTADDDCESDLCFAPAGGLPVCTAPCGEERTWCQLGASCDFDRGVCVPEAPQVGSPCEPGGEPPCGLGSCAEVDGVSRCALPCDDGCPSRTTCRAAAEGAEVCWPLTAEPGRDACACRAAGGLPRPAAWLRGLLRGGPWSAPARAARGEVLHKVPARGNSLPAES